MAGDCYDKYQIQNADKCVVCDTPLLGPFYRVGGEKVCSKACIAALASKT